jgi:hypothetical protein
VKSETVKTELVYEFTCSGADGNNIFEFIGNHEISALEFNEMFIFPEGLKQTQYLSYYFDGNWVVIYDCNSHYVYRLKNGK